MNLHSVDWEFWGGSESPCPPKSTGVASTLQRTRTGCGENNRASVLRFLHFTGLSLLCNMIFLWTQFKWESWFLTCGNHQYCMILEHWPQTMLSCTWCDPRLPLKVKKFNMLQEKRGIKIIVFLKSKSVPCIATMHFILPKIILVSIIVPFQVYENIQSYTLQAE